MLGSTLVRLPCVVPPGRLALPPGREHDVNVAPTGTLAVMRDEHPTAGKEIGRYRLVHFLGSGGTGDVWLAEDTLLGRRVALKLPHPHLVRADNIRREFLREARAGSMLDHPGIATIYDAGDSPCGPYIAMAFVDGPSLRNLVGDGSTSLEQACAWTRAAAEALAHAHARGIVHGDLSPGNLMLDRDGRVRIVDFGLARTLVGGGDSTRSEVHGTYPYMAPEILRGATPTYGSDLYALGTVLYQLLTGELPYEGRTPGIYARAVLEGHVRRSERFETRVPASLRAIVRDAIEHDPARRLADAAELDRRLRDFLEDLEATTRPTPAADRATTASPPVEMAAPWKPYVPAPLDSASLSMFEARLLQAQALLRRPDQEASIEGAIRALDTLRRLDPGHPGVLSALARASLFKGQLDRDAAWEDRAAEHVTRARAVAPADAAVLLAGADLDRVQGRHTAALEGYARVLVDEPGSVEAWVGQSWTFERVGDFGRAEEAARAAIAAAPDDWRGHSRLGGVLLNRGAFEAALEPWRRVVEIAPDHARAWSSLGSVLFQLDRFEEALDAFERSIRLQPTAVASINAGTTLFYLGRLRESMQHYERAVALTPSDPRAWGNFGSAARIVPGMEIRSEEAFGRAIVLMRERLERHPDDANGWAWLSNWLAHSRRFEESRSALETAIGLAPSSVSGLPNIAGTYELLGDDDKAIDAYRESVLRGSGLRFLEMDPTLERLRATPGWASVVEAGRARPETAPTPTPSSTQAAPPPSDGGSRNPNGRTR